jgi:DNA recombination protein RmuC
MEIAIIILLVILIGLFIWYMLQGRRKWKEQGDNLTKVVGDKVENSIGVFGDVQRRLGELTEKAKAIEEVGKSISSLQEALRSPKSKGRFGEVGLETLLMNYFPGSYDLQYRFRNGKTVDAILHVGENLVPIDSKFPFPLEDFERMVATQSDEEEKRLRSKFTRAIKKHIDAVSEYIQPDEGTFNFALLYVRAENLYYEMVAGAQANEEGDICSYCRDKSVFLVSPSTFHAYLQAIVLGLKGVQIEKFARDILGRLGRLQGDLTNFQKDYATLGTHIRNAAQKYDDGGNKLTKLSGRLELIAGENPAEELPEGSTKTLEEE